MTIVTVYEFSSLQTHYKMYKLSLTKTTNLITFLNCNLKTKYYDKFKMRLEVNLSLFWNRSGETILYY